MNLVNESLDNFLFEKKKKMKGKNPYWKGYEMIGTKEKDGRDVPNCVPKNESAEELIEEINESISDRYNDRGFTKVDAKKRAPSDTSHKWEVLAKGGDKYKIIRGGMRRMDDYSKHKDPKRKKTFWDRMGGKDSTKTKDQFSALYWHKRFKTW